MLCNCFQGCPPEWHCVPCDNKMTIKTRCMSSGKPIMLADLTQMLMDCEWHADTPQGANSPLQSLSQVRALCDHMSMCKLLCCAHTLHSDLPSNMIVEYDLKNCKWSIRPVHTRHDKSLCNDPKLTHYMCIDRSGNHFRGICNCCWNYGNDNESKNVSHTQHLAELTKKFDELAKLVQYHHHDENDGHAYYSFEEEGRRPSYNVAAAPTDVPTPPPVNNNEEQPELQVVNEENLPTPAATANEGNLIDFEEQLPPQTFLLNDCLFDMAS